MALACAAVVTSCISHSYIHENSNSQKNRCLCWSVICWSRTRPLLELGRQCMRQLLNRLNTVHYATPSVINQLPFKTLKAGKKKLKLKLLQICQLITIISYGHLKMPLSGKEIYDACQQFRPDFVSFFFGMKHFMRFTWLISLGGLLGYFV